MDVSEFVLSAGRAVLDMVEQECQPLSPGELEQRLDQAVEEILEADLMAKLKTQPPPTIYVQLLQSQADVQPQASQAATSRPPEEEIPGHREPQHAADSAAVKVPVCLLRSGLRSVSKITDVSNSVRSFHSPDVQRNSSMMTPVVLFYVLHYFQRN